MQFHFAARHVLALLATCLLPVAAQSAPITYRATGALTSIEGSSSIFSLGGSYVLDVSFDTVPDASPVPTAALAGYKLTAISFNYGGGAYVGGASSGPLLGSLTAKNNNFFTGDQVSFKAGSASGFGAIDGKVFGDDQVVLDLWDKSALAWSDASALPILSLDMFDDYLFGDEAELAMVWGEDELLIINGSVTSFGPIAVVPVPAAVWLFTGGLGMLATVRRRTAAA